MLRYGIYWILTLLIMVGCMPGPLMTGPQGQVAIQIAFPKGFKTALLKPETTSVIAAIYGTRIPLEKPLFSTPLTPDNPQTTLTTPEGQQTVIAAAYDQQQNILTAGRASVNVKGRTRLEIELSEDFNSTLTPAELDILLKAKKRLPAITLPPTTTEPFSEGKQPTIEIKPNRTFLNLPGNTQPLDPVTALRVGLNATPGNNNPDTPNQTPTISQSFTSPINTIQWQTHQITSDSIILNWRDPNFKGLMGYNIYLNNERITATARTIPNQQATFSYMVAGLQAGQEYQLEVRPVHAFFGELSPKALKLSTSSLSLVKPADHITLTLGSSTTFEALLDSYSGETLTQIEFQLNQQTIKTIDLPLADRKIQNARFKHNWNSSGSTSGSHNLQVIGKNSAGQVVLKSQSLTITINPSGGSSGLNNQPTINSVTPARAFTNAPSTVVIQGTYLGGNMTGTVGGLALTNISLTGNNQLTATIPAGLAVGTYDLILNGGGTGTSFSSIGVSTQYYVNTSATGDNNGLTWADAYTELRDALATVAVGDEVWVAAGTYKPAVPGGDRNNTFTLLSEMGLYGGFNGTETERSQSNPAVNVTTLSGDLNGDDVGLVNNIENSYHVLNASNANNVTIEGFTIQNGHANGGGALDHGGAIYNNSSKNQTLNNLTFRFNQAAGQGGAIYSENSSTLTFSNTSISDNRASRGGGLYFSNASTGILNTITLNNNTTSALEGGAILIENGSTISLIDSGFTNNGAQTNGGAIAISSTSTLTATNTNFTSNVAANNNGGAISIFNSNCTFDGGTFLTNNTALGHGGAIYSNAGTISTNNTSFLSNQTLGGGGDGGGLYCDNGSSCTLTTPTFTSNISADAAGGINVNNSTLTMSNGTFTANQAPNAGGAIRLSAASTSTITGTNFSTNQSTTSGGGGIMVDASTLTLNNNTFTSNLANAAGQSGGALYCQNAASCSISSGAFNGNGSNLNGGAIYGQDAGTTLSLTNSNFTSNAANSAGAIYCETDCGLSITGGNFNTNTATGSGGAIYNLSTGLFTINNATFDGNTAGLGGAIRAGSNANVNITNSVFNNNSNSSAVTGGGAINFGSGNLTIDNTVFTNNQSNANSAGGGVLRKTGTGVTTITNSIFKSNQASRGGVISSNTGSAPTMTIDRSIFESNSATGSGGGGLGYGGAIYIAEAITVTNTVFTGNSSNEHGGAVYLIDNVNKVFFNNTFTSNSATLRGGAITYVSGGGNTTFRSNIIFGNTAVVNDNNVYHEGGPNASFLNNDVEGSGGSGAWAGGAFGTDSGGNLDIAPLFANLADLDGPDDIWMTADDGLALIAASPVGVRDGGIAAGAPTVDILGVARPIGGGHSMGAYER